MVYFEECKVGGAVEEIGKTDEGIGGFQVQEKDSSQEGHALDVANVWSIAGIGTEHIMEGFIIRTTLCGMECSETLFVSESHPTQQSVSCRHYYNVHTSWKNPRVGNVLSTSRCITSTLCSLLRLFWEALESTGGDHMRQP